MLSVILLSVVLLSVIFRDNSLCHFDFGVMLGLPMLCAPIIWYIMLCVTQLSSIMLSVVLV